jgi:hypothetical protein
MAKQPPRGSIRGGPVKVKGRPVEGKKANQSPFNYGDPSYPKTGR